MVLYVVRRFLQIVPLLLFISALIFLLLYLMPGDPLYRMLQDIPRLRAEDYERLRKLQQLDAPSFAEMLLSIPRGDVGFERLKAKPRDVEF